MSLDISDFIWLRHLNTFSWEPGFYAKHSSQICWFPDWFSTMSQLFPVSIVHFCTEALTLPVPHNQQGPNLVIFTMPCACIAPLWSLPGPFCAHIIPLTRRQCPPFLLHPAIWLCLFWPNQKVEVGCLLGSYGELNNWSLMLLHTLMEDW